MFRKFLITSIFGAALAVMPAAAQVYVRIGPPRPLVERPVPRPGPRYVWTPGYYRWGGRAYAWVPGAWVLPPRPHAHWVRGRWAHRPGGWFFVEGHWR